jgi:hypothetical protein
VSESSDSAEVKPMGEPIGPSDPGFGLITGPEGVTGADGPGPDPVGAFGQTEPEGDGNGNGNGHVNMQRFSNRWNKLLDPHRTADKEFVLPGWDGLPFRGSVPCLKESDPEYRQPQVAYEPHVWILDLSVKEDLEDYRSVYQLVTNGSAVISAEERQYDKDIKNWRIFLRWALMFTHMPDAFSPQA